MGARFPVVSGQVPLSSDVPAANDPFNDGFCFKPDYSAVYGATTGGVGYTNGLPVTASGQLVYVDATAGLPAGTVWQNGFPISAGAVCISSAAVASYQNGLPFAPNGALCAASTSFPSVVAAKSAAASAPAPGSLQYQAQTVSYLGANAFPDLSFDRHYTSGAGIGTADFFTKTKAFFYPNSWDTLGGPTNGENDGSNAAFWTSSKGMGSVQNSNPVYVGLQTPSRYLWIPSQAGRNAQIRVDGKLLPAGSPLAWPSNNNMAKIDFGTVGGGAGRKIVIQGTPDLWLSEVCVSAGSAIVGYDWQTDANKVPAAFMGDSYQQGADYSLVGLPFVHYMAELCGFGALTQSSIGGTGYLTNNGLPQYPNMQDTTRLAVVTRESPLVVVVQAGINDPSGASANAAMAATYAAIRAALPTALIVGQTAWAPSQTAGQAAGGKYQLLRTNLYSVFAGLSGPWILIDNLSGQWSTYKGTNSGAGTGPWQTGDGNVSAPTGTGNGDTWVSADGTHPTPLGYKGLAELFATAFKAAVASL